MEIIINSIDYSGSVVDGPGIRTVIFVQGCNVRCKGCHNESTWDIEEGKKVDVIKLANEIRANSQTRSVTISGGEPLMQADAVYSLIRELKEFNIALYTSYELEEMDKKIIEEIDFLKTGPYIEALRTTIEPYIGSKNQKFYTLGELDEQ